MNPPIFAFSSIKTQHKTVTYDKPNFKEEEIFLIKGNESEIKLLWISVR